MPQLLAESALHFAVGLICSFSLPTEYKLTVMSPVGLWTTDLKTRVWHYGCYHLSLEPEVTIFERERGAGTAGLVLSPVSMRRKLHSS